MLDKKALRINQREKGPWTSITLNQTKEKELKIFCLEVYMKTCAVSKNFAKVSMLKLC